MSSLILPRRFKSQPQYSAPIDYSGLGRGTKFLINPAVGAVDLVTGRQWQTSGTARVVTGAKGRAFKLDSAGSRINAASSYPELSGPGTFFAHLPKVGAYSAFGMMFMRIPGVMSIQTTQFGELAQNGVIYSSFGAWANTENRSIVWNYGPAAIQLRVYVDGKLVLTGPSGSPTAIPNTAKEIQIGGSSTGTSWDLIGDVLVAGWTSAAWGEAEARAFHENPNLLFKARTRRVWAVIEGGSALNLTAASASQSSESASGQIVQTHNLAAESSIQSSESVSDQIVQTHNLAAEGSTQDSASGTGAITQESLLVGPSSEQSSVSGVGVIVQTHNLAGAGSTQSSVSGTGEVSQEILFSAPYSEQSSVSGTGQIVQTHNLVAADSAQSSVSPSGQIAQTHNLVVASSIQGSASGTGEVSQDTLIVLSAAGASQSSSASTGAIVQTHNLAAEPSAQESIAASGAIAQAHVLIALSCSQGSISATAMLLPDGIWWNVERAFSVAAESRAHTVAAESRAHTVVAV